MQMFFLRTLHETKRNFKKPQENTESVLENFGKTVKVCTSYTAYTAHATYRKFWEKYLRKGEEDKYNKNQRRNHSTILVGEWKSFKSSIYRQKVSYN